MKTSLTVNPVNRNWNQLRITFGGICRAFTERLSSGWKTLSLRWWHFPTSDLGREGFREEAVPAYFHSLSRECECIPPPASVTAAASACLRLQTLLPSKVDSTILTFTSSFSCARWLYRGLAER